ncbi:MAG TPA: cupin domain-containing protein [Acidisoma sp.]|uniref:cupin domain-containing protein n=1 Tax=Acidisoma sp. TaxID=1872115 RepID=UPI002B83EEDD|nr:cupin domain-containing protein [Acidisoma sp.]HTI00691.1 cupin domain-containing protein [Acidisoma sp.]
MKIKARSLNDIKNWSSHAGEEFIYVIKGTVTLYTEFYSPLELKVGESAYMHSEMESSAAKLTLREGAEPQSRRRGVPHRRLFGNQIVSKRGTRTPALGLSAAIRRPHQFQGCHFSEPISALAFAELLTTTR